MRYLPLSQELLELKNYKNLLQLVQACLLIGNSLPLWLYKQRLMKDRWGLHTDTHRLARVVYLQIYNRLWSFYVDLERL